MWFRCLMCNLSGPCDLLFLLGCIAYWIWVVNVMWYPCILYVALLVYLFVLCVACLTVFVNCLVKQFAMFLGVVAILLLNVMNAFSVGGGALLDRQCMVFQRICVLCLWSQCASKFSFHRFCLCFRMSEVISSFKSLRAGSQVLALLILFLCVVLHTMWSGKSLQLMCILPFGMLCLSAISMKFVKIMLTVYMLVGMMVWAKADSVSSVNCVQSAFL